MDQKKQQLISLNSEMKRLQFEVSKLEHNRVAQEKEIRRTLGYAATDEIIFDFVSSDLSK
jgi:cell division protein FtsB